MIFFFQQVAHLIDVNSCVQDWHRRRHPARRHDGDDDSVPCGVRDVRQRRPERFVGRGDIRGRDVYGVHRSVQDDVCGPVHVDGHADKHEYVLYFCRQIDFRIICIS
jgi:hypothetical protein